MRKICLFTMAVGLLFPMVALTAGPASAAAGTTCAKPTGSITISPGLTTTLTPQTISIALPIKGCVGGGVTAGTSKGSIKTPPIDLSNLASGKPLTLNATITWNNKQTTTFSASAAAKVGAGNKISALVKGKVTKGLFVGGTVSVNVAVKLGPLVHNAVKNLIITGTTAFVIT